MAYGNLGYRAPGFAPPSSHRYSRHAAESTLEIGLEITKELAETLRRGDLVQITARIEHVDTQLESGNGPDTLLYVVEMKATEMGE